MFVIASGRDGFSPAKVLFESEGVCRDITKSGAIRKANGQGFKESVNNESNELSLFSKQAISKYKKSEISSTLLARDFKGGSDLILEKSKKKCIINYERVTCFAQNNSNVVRLQGGNGNIAGCLSSSQSGKPGQGSRPTIMCSSDMSVRRLTPVECERLQGFPDDYTRVEFRGGIAKDSPRYKAIGNSKAVPVVKWIGERICKQLAVMSKS